MPKISKELLAVLTQECMGDPKYSINYGVYSQPDGETSEVGSISEAKKKYHASEKKSAACFSGLGELMAGYVNAYGIIPNRVVYECNMKMNEPHISAETARKWLELCKDNRLVPEATDIDAFLDTGNFVLDLAGLNLTSAYLYLCSVRYLQEEPKMVEAVLAAVGEFEADFFVSLAVSHRTLVTRDVHSILDYYRTYGPCNANAPESVQFDITKAIRLKRMIHTGHFGTNPSFSDLASRVGVAGLIDTPDDPVRKLKGMSFNMHSTVKATNIGNILPPKMPLDKALGIRISGNGLDYTPPQ